MSQEILEAKSALKALVDTFSNLADEKRIPDQTLLLTPDANVQVYMGDELLVDISGHAVRNLVAPNLVALGIVALAITEGRRAWRGDDCSCASSAAPTLN